MLDLKILFVALAWHDQTYVECGVQLQQKYFISRGSQRKAWNVTVTNFCYFRISYSWWTAALLASQNTEFPKYTIFCIIMISLSSRVPKIFICVVCGLPKSSYECILLSIYQIHPLSFSIISQGGRGVVIWLVIIESFDSEHSCDIPV